ncbi:elongation factor G-like protein EF-G2 [Nocardioides sp. Root151]|uniref:elongation factor G-like protein EF-G2 n=1 Tax=Nocardioides sp. Root151 TaxID=1736475 RepID=UPI0007036BE1|nr:elongation factor G-like protein EF-G2 [Nocardioides sp. Root151]KQZ67089.1 elongation factor G [Nocardioides sp. Root151]
MAERQPHKDSRPLDPPTPDRIRNIVLVGPSSAGKTTLLEGLLKEAGAITRVGTVEDGTTVSDFEEGEHEHGRSMSLAVAPVLYDGAKLNFLDTPGYADFVGELRAGLRAADCALFVVAANEQVDRGTVQLWRECDRVGMPRALVVTKLDHARADVDAVVRAAQDAFGDKVLPVHLQKGDRLVGLISGDPDDDRAQQLRGELIEGVIEESEDESLMDRYLAGEKIDEDLLVADLEKAVARAALFPVIPVGATTGVGLRELLDLCVRAFPSPAEHPAREVFTPAGKKADALTSDPSAPLVAEVIKTTSDPYLGRVSLIRVFSGSFDADADVHVSGHFSSFFGSATSHADHDDDERIGGLSYPFGKQLVTARKVVAGDIAAIGRLTSAETGDTLSSVEQPRVLEPWQLPEPLLPVAIEAATKSDEDKLPAALARLAAEDPSLKVENNTETRQLVLWVLGEAHADAALDRLQRRFGVTVEQRDLVVPLREAFTVAAKGHGRHVKQSGGHGQYAICDIEVEPLPEPVGFEFVDKVVGGAVPRQFIGSVEKGVRAQMERGVRNGYPVVGLRVTLTDGKSHSVDSSDAAFQSAGALALREAAEDGRVAMLEPYDEVSVSVPDDFVGAVMSDLSARHGRVLGTDKVGDDGTLIRALVPQRELARYAIELRSTTHGTGSFTRTFAHHEPMAEEHARDVTPRT